MIVRDLPDYDTLTIAEPDDDILLVGLNRPDRLNAINATTGLGNPYTALYGSPVYEASQRAGGNHWQRMDGAIAGVGTRRTVL